MVGSIEKLEHLSAAFHLEIKFFSEPSVFVPVYYRHC